MFNSRIPVPHHQAIYIHFHTDRSPLLKTITGSHFPKSLLFIGMPCQRRYQSFQPWRSSAALLARLPIFLPKHQFLCLPFNYTTTLFDTSIPWTTYNTAVSGAASEILGKERRRKKPWVTKDVLDLCDERRYLKKKRYEAEGAEEYREINRRIQKAVKKAKEDWIGAQC